MFHASTFRFIINCGVHSDIKLLSDIKIEFCGFSAYHRQISRRIYAAITQFITIPFNAMHAMMNRNSTAVKIQLKRAFFFSALKL